MSNNEKTPKTRDKSKKRNTILEGAIEVFIEDSYELASMDKIAERAGVSKRTVYNHFGSKENLFETVVDDFLAKRQALKTIQYNPNEALEPQLLRFAEAELFLVDTPKRAGLSKVMTITFLNNLAYARETVNKYPSPHQDFVNWLDAARIDNRVTYDNPMVAARVFYSMVEGGLTYPALFAGGHNREMAAPIVNELIDTFIAKYAVQE